MGSGALFFALQPERAVLSDSDEQLMECYQEVRDNCDEVIGELRRLRNSNIDYYRTRQANPRTPAARAARLIYLIKLSFNGIYRVNRSTGRFNVPYGWRTEREVLQEDQLKAARWALRRAETVCCDFDAVLRMAEPGDLVYLDPPYTLAHTNNGFVRYNQRLFSWADQVRLARSAAELAANGVHVIVSNAPHASIIKLYPGFDRTRIKRSSQIAADPSYRGSVTELVMTANL